MLRPQKNMEDSPSPSPQLWASPPRDGRLHHAMLPHGEEPGPHALCRGPQAAAGTWRCHWKTSVFRGKTHYFYGSMVTSVLGSV